MLKLELQSFGHLMRRIDSLDKTLMLAKIEGQERGVTEDEMVGWPHRLDGHEFEQSLGESAGQGSWHAAAPGVAESDTAEGLNSGGCSHPCWLHISSMWTKLLQTGALIVRATPLQQLVQFLQTAGLREGA